MGPEDRGCNCHGSDPPGDGLLHRKDPALALTGQDTWGQRRPDPPADIFELHDHPYLGEGVHRILKRWIRAWRAVNHEERDAIFHQVPEPGSGFWRDGPKRLSSRPISGSA